MSHTYVNDTKYVTHYKSWNCKCTQDKKKTAAMPSRAKETEKKFI